MILKFLHFFISGLTTLPSPLDRLNPAVLISALMKLLVDTRKSTHFIKYHSQLNSREGHIMYVTVEN